MAHIHKLAAVIAGVLALAGTSGYLSAAGNTDEKAGKEMSYPGDQAFVDKAAKSGLKEVRISTMAEQKTEAGDVRDIAKTMVTDHTAVNEKLKSIASAKGLQVPEKMSDDAEKVKQELDQKKGADFDAAYAKDLVHSHEKSVALFRAASEKADAPELRNFAKETLPKIEHHLQMAKNLDAKKR
ncbi:DUF4142 domain-containing protein [Tahibacter amnicola]|uniref:DUF4142 domain-containing protein n=1 Tax=Tahibacter amnicola TaxID=2976241 RepID=A0ABY6BGT9_9GAMM|nr:DUF4142 domain-containing protein [Tahibacter amnicola]UXI67585.1 DUF4142 domain-containing protein [Tahibacter amnicola]